MKNSSSSFSILPGLSGFQNCERLPGCLFCWNLDAGCLLDDALSISREVGGDEDDVGGVRMMGII